MADQNLVPTPTRGRQPGEPAGRPFDLTTGPVDLLQRPGGLPGSTSGGEGDVGRNGVVPLIDADDETLSGGATLQAIAPHTGY